jgi:hypothetical protein
LQNEVVNPTALIENSDDLKEKEVKETVIRAVPNQQITRIL